VNLYVNEAVSSYAHVCTNVIVVV